MRLVPKTIFKVKDKRNFNSASAKFGLHNLTADELFVDKRVVLFALPAAFATTSSTDHLIGYEKRWDSFVTLGIDRIFCLSVNDPFVMDEWGKFLDIKYIQLLPDGNGEFTRKMGMLVEKSNLNCGLRSWRYSMFAEDGVIKKVFVEDGFSDNSLNDPFEVTDAETMLNYLQTWREPFP